jgi:hypothetical protein
MSSITSIIVVLDVLMVALIALSMSGALTPGPGPATTTADNTTVETAQPRHNTR